MSRRTHAEPGVWLIVIGDLVVFVVLFGLFLHERADQPAVFAASQDRLHPAFGFVDTLLLLCSSLAAVAGVNASRAGAREVARRAFGVAIALGGCFVVSKAIEWSIEAGSGLTPDRDDFFQLYFVLTGLHLLHVLIGLGVLCVARALAAEDGPYDQRLVEGAAVFWHLVDLLWLVLFPLLYFVR